MRMKFIISLLLLTVAFTKQVKAIAPADLDTNRLATIQWDELNPRAIGFVKDYLEVHEERLMKMKDWGQPYFLIIENILKKVSTAGNPEIPRRH